MRQTPGGFVRPGAAQQCPPFMRCSTSGNTVQERLLATSWHSKGSTPLGRQSTRQGGPLHSHCRQQLGHKRLSCVPSKLHRAKGCTVSAHLGTSGLSLRLHHQYLLATSLGNNLRTHRGEPLRALHPTPRRLSQSQRSFCRPPPGALHTTHSHQEMVAYKNQRKFSYEDPMAR